MLLAAYVRNFKNREVPNGVGADGVGVKFPIFPVTCSRLPLSHKNRRKTKKNEEKRRKTKKNEEKRRKKKRKNWENPSDPIYTNPIKNLPKEGGISQSPDLPLPHGLAPSETMV